ncbi:hypothetical protein [Labilibacter marinus]|uniref:hypothetical protein n=1 Tax=Labilibacter marinus TaxID=1477105 RepID=UPI00094FA5AA|nr:hypothetical protein [Labilibacter marinus]
MKSFSKLTIDEKISSVETKAKNSLANPEILEKLSLFNVNEEYVAQTLTCALTARSASQQQEKEYSEKLTATDRRDAALEEVELIYDDTMQLARMVMVNANFDTALKIGIQLPAAIGKKIERLRSFYAGITTDVNLLPLLTRFNRGIEVLQTEQQKVEELAELQRLQVQEKGEAQAATQERNEALEVMIERNREFTTLLKIALGKRNDLLESVGIFVRS